MPKIKNFFINFEYYLCLSIWAGSVIYSQKCFYSYSLKIQSTLDSNDFKQGWFRNRLKDVSDLEWNIISQTFLSNLHLIIGHSCLSQIVQMLYPKFFLHFIIVYDSIFIINLLSFQAYFLFIFNIFIVILIHLRLQKLFAYLFLFFQLTSVSYPEFSDLKEYLFENNSNKKFLFEVAFIWLNAKLLSFNLDRSNEIKKSEDNKDEDFDLIFATNMKKIDFKEYLQIFAYLFYLPTFFTGPLSHYNNFVKDVKNHQVFKPFKVLIIILKTIKYVVWIFTFECSLHYFYTTALQFYPTLLYSLDAWTLCGFGFSLTCLFFIKYFIIYGLAQNLSELDQISIPPPPRCTTRIHSSSLLWRHFDRGLYFWLKDYFYKPMISGNYSYINKISASFICFTYVCLWHRMEDSSIVWCTLNFIVIVIEQSFLYYIEKNKILSFINNQLTDINKKRLNALISAPFFAIMIISNIYFLSNVEVGNYFFKRVMFKMPVPSIPLVIIMYCGCFYSINRLSDLS